MHDRYLFRGKTLATGGWMNGYYFFNGIHQTHHIFTLSPDNHVCMHAIDPATLGRCTGLRDKNGKLTFEGDVLEPPGESPMIVKFGQYKHIDAQEGYPNGDVGFYVESIDSEAKGWLRNDILFWIACSAVIGDICETPALLEVQNDDPMQ